ncbi:MAG: FadR family transcriptional regulator [Thermoleophilia bacterium]|nr:FadR family transcriptional regulator [Thermoleophilia bacterium]
MSTSPTAKDSVFAPVQVEGAVEKIVRRLGEAIGSGLLGPGERLPSELELADRLNVAPMTLRQALAILRDAGYVETRRGRGAGSFVASTITAPLISTGSVPTEPELRDLVDWRRTISGESAALAAERANPATRQRIVAVAAQADAAASGAYGAYRLADSAFHVAVAQASGSSRLMVAETSIQAEFNQIFGSLPGTNSTLALRSSTLGHEPIVAAIVAANPSAARLAMEQHVEAIYDWILGLHLGRL